MNQEVIEAGLEGLERKVLLLLKERKTLKDELKNTKAENKNLKADMRDKERTIARFSDTVKVDKIADHINASGNNNNIGLKKKVNEYILEIDRCIAHLNM